MNIATSRLRLGLALALILITAVPVFGTETNPREQRRLRLVSIGTQDQIVATVNRDGAYRAIRNPGVEAKVRPLIEQVHRAFVAMLPEARELKSFPDFVVVTNTLPIDFGIMFPRELQLPDRYSGVLMVPDNAFTTTYGTDVLVGIIAHEIAHLYFNHQIRTGQFWDPTIDGQPAPVETKSLMSRYLYLTKLVGEDANPELGGLPTEADLNDKLNRMVSDLKTLATSKGNACGVTTADALRAVGEVVQSRRDRFSQLAYFDDASAAKMKILVTNFKSSFKSCANAVGFAGIDLAIWTTPRPDGYKVSFPAVIEPLLGRKIDFESESELDVLLAAGAAAQAEMRDLWQTHRLSRVVWRSPEDEADEVAMYILAMLKIKPNMLIGVLYLYSSANPKSEDLTACFQTFTNGKLPPIGSPTEPHHAPCYRAVSLVQAFGQSVAALRR